MRGCFDTPSIAFCIQHAICSFLPFQKICAKENLPALDKGLLIILPIKSPRHKTHHQPAESVSVRERYSRQPADHTSVAGRRY